MREDVPHWQARFGSLSQNSILAVSDKTFCSHGLQPSKEKEGQASAWRIPVTDGTDRCSATGT